MMNSLLSYPSRLLWSSTPARPANTASTSPSETRSVKTRFPAVSPQTTATATTTKTTVVAVTTVAVAAPKKDAKKPPPASPALKKQLLEKPPKRAIFYTTTATATPLHRVPKRPRAKSPKSPPSVNRSPLVRRIPSLLGEHEEFVSDEERSVRESTPRSKRLRRSTLTWDPLLQQFRTARENTAMFSVTNMADNNNNENTSKDNSTTGNNSNKKSRNSPVVAAKKEMQDDEGQGWNGELHDGELGEEEYSLIREADETQQLSELREEGFTAQEAALFLRIRNRGLEPLLPAHWEVDFATMPENLFFPEKGNQVGHIDSVALDGTFQATNALQALVMLGGTVRGRIESKRDPEDRVMAALKKYIQWSVEDVKASNYKEYSEIYPRIVLVRSNGRGAEYTEARIRRKLADLAAEVRAEEARLAAAGVPRDPETASSTLYGIAVSGAVVALLTLDAHSTDGNDSTAPPTPRTMIILDFSDLTLDFWNAIAVALIVIAGREDELERNEFYQSHDLKMTPPLSSSKKRGWEIRSRTNAAFDADDDK